LPDQLRLLNEKPQLQRILTRSDAPAMPAFTDNVVQLAARNSAFFCPACAQCRTQMTLSTIEPHERASYLLETFRCEACGLVEKIAETARRQCRTG
jgi:hypothetical protein